MCYISMDSSERVLQINQKLLSNFKLIFVILAENQKKNIQKSSEV